MWEKIKEIAGDVYGLSAMAWVMTHLILIEVKGTVRIYEGNPWILWIEIVGTALLICLAIERFIKDVRSK